MIFPFYDFSPFAIKFILDLTINWQVDLKDLSDILDLSVKDEPQ